MIQRRHRRRRRQAEDTHKNVRLIKLGVWVVLLLLVFKAGSSTLSFFGVGNAIRKTSAVLKIEDRGVINVAVEGGPLKRAENELKLYAGDTVVSSPRNYATLDFFDGTSVRLDESSQVRIIESEEGEEKSKLTVELEEGTVWLASPTLDVFSGSVARILVSPYLSASIPSKAELIFTPRSLSVFSADGLGLEVTVAGSDQKVIIGEGQQFTLPVGGEKEIDLYALRNPLDPNQLQSEFVEQSRAVHANRKVPDEIVVTGDDPDVPELDTALTVLLPEDDSVVQGSTVEVSGRIGSSIDKVRINGYLSNIDKDTGTFKQELALADEDEVRITVEAVDEKGVVVAESQRTVKRNRKPPEAPVISRPAQAGEVYRTNSPEIEISGTAPDGAIGIIVNDYRLQLFKPGNPDWSYLANVDFGNFFAGENTFEVVAINRGGYRSEAAVLTVILGEGTEGIVTDDTENEEGETADSSRPTTPDEADQKNNLPLMPGSVEIFAPTRGEPYETSELEFLIEGNVPPEASSVWVNGYKLQLFEQGKGFFNYIASAELNTLKRGRNVYDIVVRSEEGYILDSVKYVVNFTAP